MSDTQLEVIDVTVTPLPSPLRLASTSFLSSLKEVETQIEQLEVKDSASAQLAANLQQRLTKAGAVLEQTRAALKAPVLEQGRAIDAAAAKPSSRIEAAKAKLKGQLVAYDFRCRQKAEEEERARQVELRRLEALRLAEEEAARKRQEELDRLAREAAEKNKVPVVDMDFDDDTPAVAPEKTETEKAIENLQHTPVVAAAKPVGITYRVTLLPRVTDVNKLPDVFVERVAKLRAIQQTFCVGWKEGEPLPECSGVAFVVERTPVSTGRGGF